MSIQGVNLFICNVCKEQFKHSGLAVMDQEHLGVNHVSLINSNWLNLLYPVVNPYQIMHSGT